MKIAAGILIGLVVSNLAWLAFYGFSPPPRKAGP
jgi:hypothetical protein